MANNKQENYHFPTESAYLTKEQKKQLEAIGKENTKNRRRGSGFDAPVIGITLPAGTKYIKLPSGRVKIVPPIEQEKSMMNDELKQLFKEVCSDFEEYHFLQNDLYKGKLIGGFNVYYKKGNDNKEGMVTGKNNVKRFELEQFPYNFISSTGYGVSQKDEKGWTDEELIKVLMHIKTIINKKNFKK